MHSLTLFKHDILEQDSKLSYSKIANSTLFFLIILSTNENEVKPTTTTIPVVAPENQVRVESAPEPIKRSIINVFSTSKKRLLVEDTHMKIEDLRMISNYSGRGLWTKVYVKLNPAEQFLYIKEPFHDIKYEIFEGDAWIMQGTKGEMVSKGDICIVEKGVPHTVLSTKITLCRFAMEVIGDYDLVKVINDSLNK